MRSGSVMSGWYTYNDLLVCSIMSTWYTDNEYLVFCTMSADVLYNGGWYTVQ